jgi:hypothetical protein
VERVWNQFPVRHREPAPSFVRHQCRQPFLWILEAPNKNKAAQRALDGFAGAGPPPLPIAGTEIPRLGSVGDLATLFKEGASRILIKPIHDT